jgi:maleamate amidohydrolase
MATEATRKIYDRAQLGRRLGYGSRPALLVIDMQLGFTAPEKCPLAGNLDSQVAAINQLIDAARPRRTRLMQDCGQRRGQVCVCSFRAAS